MRQLQIFFIFLFVFSSTGSALAQPLDLNLLAQAGFNPNLIITDFEMGDYLAMTLEDIKNFLADKPGVLTTYEVLTPLGMNKSAAEVIFEASQTYKINPRVLLALLQKEQSLIENPNPSQHNFNWATGYALCDSCSSDDPTLAKWHGFAKQVDAAAGALRYYFDNAKNGWLRQHGRIYNIDGIPVIPANQATANLYTYTPHLAGNYNFWRVWQRWFSSNKILPDGVVVRAKDDEQIWLIKNGRQHPFKAVAFHSRFQTKNVLTVATDILNQHEKGPAIKYPNYSLIKNSAKEIYLLADGQKRLIDKSSFRYFGFNPEEVMAAADEDLEPYDLGEPIVKNKKYPLGVLMQDKKTKEIFWAADGAKHLVLDKKIAEFNWGKYKPRLTTTAEIKKLAAGEPIKFSDGALLQTTDSLAVYLVSNGERRWIKNNTTFEALGFSWDNVINVSQAVLELHTESEPIILPSSSLALNP